MRDSYETLKKSVADNLRDHSRLIVAIDGCCASGKTTLASRLAADLQADLIHMDDFFLPPALRTPMRYEEPGGNVHYERFHAQIARPLLDARSSDPKNRSSSDLKSQPASDTKRRTDFQTKTGWPVLYWDRFVCADGTFAPDLCHTGGKPLLIIEGCYCMRPEFRPLYDLSFFFRTTGEEQLRRIRLRNGDERLPMFRNKWIPLENRYFSYYHIAEHCHFQIDT